MDLRTKLVLALVAASLLSMLALGAMAYGMADRQLTDRAREELSSLVEAKRGDLQNLAEGWRDRVSLIASRTQLRLSLAEYNETRSTRSRARILQIVTDARQASRTVSWVAVYDGEGRPVAWSGLGPERVPPEPLDSVARGSLADSIHFQGVSFANGDRPFLHFLAPLFLDGRRVGAIRVALGSRDLLELTADPDELGRTGEILLALRDAAGEVRVLTPGVDSVASFGWESVDEQADGLVQRALDGEEGPWTEGMTDAEGQNVWAAARSLPELGWAIVVKFDADEEREVILGFREQLVAVGFSLSAFAILFGVLLGLRFAEPIQDLAAVANRIRMGELGARAELNREDELGLLALTFNEMAEELEDQVQLLREYERFFDVSPDMLCIARPDGYFERVNPAFERILGWSEEELLDRPFKAFVHPDDVAKTERETARLAQGIPTVSFSNRYRRPDGSYTRLIWTCHPDPETGLLYAVARHAPEEHEDEYEEGDRRAPEPDADSGEGGQ